MSEADKFLDDLVESWVEVHKKSTTTVFLLCIISKEKELSTAQILTCLSGVSGRSLTERGLYRTLQRLVSNYLFAVDTRPGVCPGLKRKVLTVTDSGRAHLARIGAEYQKQNPALLSRASFLLEEECGSSKQNTSQGLDTLEVMNDMSRHPFSAPDLDDTWTDHPYYEEHWVQPPNPMKKRLARSRSAWDTACP